jgi:hypothetical protein
MRALKALVIMLGVLLVGGTMVLVGVIIARLAHPPASDASAPRPGEFGRSVVDLPKGAQILSTQSTADRLVLEIALPGGARQLLLLDPHNGRLAGTVELHSPP